MKKVFFALMALMGLMYHQTQAQCLDTVPWGTSIAFENSCWTVAPGSNWEGEYSQYVSDFDTTADHRLLSPWIEIPATAAIDSVVVRYGTTVVCKADLSVCVTTDGVTYDTLRRELRDAAEASYKGDTLYLGAYAGQMIRIVFCRHGLSSDYNYFTDGCPNPDVSWNLIVGGIRLLSLNPPQAWATVTERSFVGEPTVWRAGLNLGSHTGLTYTWHSSLMGQTLTGDSVTMTYSAAGVDTVTMVASNAYGSDTVVNVIQVYDCQGVITAHPWIVNFETEYDCWRSIGAGRWNRSGNSITAYNDGDKIFTSPAVVLPADSTGLRLYWKAKNNAWSGSVTYQVLVTTTDRFNIGSYDTLFSASQNTTQAQRSVSLADYAGDTVYIAFRQKDQNSRNIQISDVRMYNALVPLGTLEAPTYAVATGDTVRYTLHLTQGDSVSYSWYSALLDTSITTIDSMVSIVYPFPGSETLTATASNAHGTLTLEKSLGVYGCDTINVFPWSEGFVETGSVASYNACWEIVGYYRLPDNYGYGFDEEDGSQSGSINRHDFMRSSTRWDYMLTPPIAVPAVLEKNLSLWVEHFYSLMAIVETEEGNADTVYSLDSREMTMRRRPISLLPYAGQTIRVRLLNNSSHASYAESLVDRIRVDYDTVPVVVLSAQEKTTTDSATLFVAQQLRGFNTSLSYSWQSQVGGTFTTNAAGDSAWVTYGAGITGLNDTVSVTVTNSYCSYTTRRAIRIIDCLPADTLPWVETFTEGIACWYKPEGSNWAASTYYGYDPKCMTSGRVNDSVPHWIMSKAVDVPADTALAVRLFWDVSSSNANYPLNYSVWVTTSEDYTDTANYTMLYIDTAKHSVYRTFDHLSTSLVSYAGQTIHVAFRKMKMNSSVIAMYIDNVVVRSTALPIVSLEASSMVDSHEPVTYSATLTEGSPNGMTVTWHSSLMDTTWVDSTFNFQFSTFNLTYTLGGRDTITVTASNIYGSSSATAVVLVTNCSPIATLPYEETFNDVYPLPYNYSSGGYVPNCWHRYWEGSTSYEPHVINSYYQSATNINTYVQNNNALVMLAGTDSGYDSVALVETPVFDVPLAGKQLSFYYMFEAAVRGELTVGYMQNADFVSFAQVEPSTTGRTRYVRLDSLPSDVNRIAFRWKCNAYWYGAILDDIRVGEPDSVPMIAIVPNYWTGYLGDTTTITAQFQNGLTDSLSYHWHSSLMDTIIVTTAPLLTIVYDIEGYDTLTLAAINAYGSDTAVAYVNVFSHPLPQVTLSAPAEIPLGDSVTLAATLNNCSRNALSLTLHSSLLDSTITLNSNLLTLNYSHSGVDTLTLIASNAYGADTVLAIVRVYDCGNVAVPYFMDFEDVTATNYNVAGQLPLCWNRTWNGSNTAFAPHVIPVGGYPYLSNLPSKSFLMLAGNASGYSNQAEVVLPRFADSLQHLSFAFDYRFEASSWGVLSVGYYDTTGTFVTVRNLSPYAGAYRRDTVVFSSVPLLDAQIAMRWTNSNSYYALAIDNIHVFVDNNIPAPAGLTADNITASCATLRWNAVTGATAYHLILPGIVDTLLADTALSVCGLDEDSDYGFGVYAHVGDEVGHFSGLHPFHTLLYCMPLASLSANVDGIVRWQYDTTGEAMGTGVALEIADVTNGAMWADTVLGDSLVYPFAIGHRYSLTARTLCGNAEAHTTLTIPLQIPASVCAESAGSSTATNERFMDNFWSRNYSQIIYPASFAAGIDTLFGIALRVSQFSQPFADTANYNYDIFLGQTDSATLSAPLTSDSLTQVAFNKRITIRSAGWIEIPFDSVYPCNPTGNLIVTLVERTSSAYSGRHYGVHTDASCTHFVQSTENHYYTNPSTLNFDWDITTDIPDIRLLGGCSSSLCLAPVAAISAVDTHHVELQWVARGSEGLWQVEYRPAGQTAWTVADTTSANSYTVGGLHAMTTYEFRVASICDGGLQYGSTLTATTPCGEISLPYHIDFRNNEIPCWTIHTGVSHSSSYGLNMYSGEWAISPLVDDSIARLYATITTYGGSSSSYPESYAVGICNADGSNPVWVDTILLSTQYGNHQHTVYFNNYSGMGDHIIVKIVSGLLDLREFALDYVDFCIPAQNVEATAITDSSAVLQWTANASGHTFAVYLDDVLQTVTSATTYSFTGLAPRTRYLAAVREICGAGDTAAAATRYFRTQCTPTTDLPYFEEFDYSSDLYGDTIGLPPCWDSIGYSHISFSSFSGGALTVMTFYSFEDYTGPYTSYLATPLLNIPSQGARIRFKGQTGHDDVVTAGIMTDPTDASTFIPMATITYNNRGLAWYEFTTEGLDSLNSQFAVAFRWASEGSGSLDSLFVTALPEGHTVTVTANEEGVCETYGSGIYADGSSVVIGYRLLDTLPQGGHWEFLGWSDGASGNPRTLVVTSDTAVVALFEWVTDPVTDTVWRTVTVRLVDLATGNTIEESDVVYVEGAGRYMDSTMVTLTAHYADTPLFYGWVTTAGDTISSNPFRFIVTCDTLITAVYAPLPVGIDEVESSKWKVEIFPNPATTEVTILTQAIKQSDNQAITILDLHGRVVYTQAIRHSSTQAITIDISSLPRGVYYVRIGSVVKKLVIQ